MSHIVWPLSHIPPLQFCIGKHAGQRCPVSSGVRGALHVHALFYCQWPPPCVVTTCMHAKVGLRNPGSLHTHMSQLQDIAKKHALSMCAFYRGFMCRSPHAHVCQISTWPHNHAWPDMTVICSTASATHCMRGSLKRSQNSAARVFFARHLGAACAAGPRAVCVAIAKTHRSRA